MSDLNDSEQEFWNTYLASLPEAERPSDVSIDAEMAGDERTADSLLALYLDGRKTAGSSLVREYKLLAEALPEPGKFWIVLDGARKPRCIVKTVRTLRFAFRDVPVEVAMAEGEGDCTTAYWKRAHREFFGPYLEEWGVIDLDAEEVVAEFFEVVFTGNPTIF